MASPNILVAKILGAVFLLIGIIGFFTEPVLIIFGVNALHNWVHVLSGVALLAAAFVADGVYARTANRTLGIVYLLVAVLGFFNVVVPGLLNTDASTVPYADDVLHLVLTVILLGVGFGVPTERRTGRPVT